jgi:hypothetical protein
MSEAQRRFVRQRPYRREYTGSLSNSEVNHGRARSVLGWGTAREALGVLLPFCFGRCSWVSVSREWPPVFVNRARPPRGLSGEWARARSFLCVPCS